MRPRTVFLTGLLMGGFSGLAYLVMPITLFLLAPVWALFLHRNGSRPAVAGGLVGFGAAWVLMVGRVTLACASDSTCVEPNIVWLWFAPGVAALAAGLSLGFRKSSKSTD